MNFKKKLFLAIIIPLAIIFIAILVILFLSKDIDKKIQERNLIRTQVSYWREAIDSIAVLQGDYKKAEPYFTAVQKIISSQDELIGFSSEIASVGARHNVGATASLGKENVDDKSGLRKTPALIVASGKSADIIGFMKDVEASRFFIQINSLDISRSEENFRVSLTGSVFSL